MGELNNRVVIHILIQPITLIHDTNCTQNKQGKGCHRADFNEIAEREQGADGSSPAPKIIND
jgi:hypothetical protein